MGIKGLITVLEERFPWLLVEGGKGGHGCVASIDDSMAWLFAQTALNTAPRLHVSSDFLYQAWARRHKAFFRKADQSHLTWVVVIFDRPDRRVPWGLKEMARQERKKASKGIQLIPSHYVLHRNGYYEPASLAKHGVKRPDDLPFSAFHSIDVMAMCRTPADPVGTVDWRLAIGDWRLAIGDWRLAIGDLAIGDCN
jgi:hypothetical protein